jgi:WD40 repeat protein/uncharacterized caspase-like protein
MQKHFQLLFLLLLLQVVNTSLAQKPELILPAANNNQMQAVAISRDEQLYASADLDGKVKIWEAATGKLLKNLVRTNINNLAFTPDNNSLIITSFKPVEVYNIKTGNSTIISNHLYQDGLDISPDGKWIATSGDGGADQRKLYTWNTATLQLKDSIKINYSNNRIKFSPDSKLIALYGSNEVEIISVEKNQLLFKLSGHTQRAESVVFSNDNTQLLTCSWDNTAKLWDLKTSNLVTSYNGHKAAIWNIQFHPDGKKVITTSSDMTAKIWDKLSGQLVKTLTNHRSWIYRCRISPDGKTYAMGDLAGYCTVWDAAADTMLFNFRPGKETLYFLNYLKSGKHILAGNYDPSLSRWNIATRKNEMYCGIYNERYTSISLSKDEKYLLTTSRDGRVRKIDAMNGKVLFTVDAIKGGQWATSADFSNDGELIAVAGGESSTILLNSYGGIENRLSDRSKSYESSSIFSPNDKYILHNDEYTVQLVRLEDNKRVLVVDSISMFTEQRFSPDGQYIITAGKGKVQVWSVQNQQLVHTKFSKTSFPAHIEISPDSKYFLSVDSHNGITEIWELVTGKLIKTINKALQVSFLQDKEHLLAMYSNGQVIKSRIQDDVIVKSVQLNDSSYIRKSHLSKSETLLISFSGSDILLRDLTTGKTINRIGGNNFAIGKSEKYLYVLTDDATEVYHLPAAKLAYRHYTTGLKDYLVEDENGRYDGTPNALKSLYFVCGKEIIELNQAKDQLWVPELAQRIMKGETINAKTINELNICNLTPEVERKNNAGTGYTFIIKPRRGGLGETIVYINGIEAKRYTPSQLKKNGALYELQIKKEEMSAYFIAGKENPITVKAFAGDNTISSRNLIINTDSTKKNNTPPNLYGIMVGVSDYKGEELDLKYAAKDATDISSAIAKCARKLLNSDGKEHVFMYNLTTDANRYLLPEKKGIQKTLEEISKKATANDIVMIFFAGHGINDPNKKQFYFLTADASKVSAADAINDVGISTNELTEWMKPEKLKAQKRILIFDACNSGQAIRDFVKLGNDPSYMAARNDETAQQKKAIDKLNEKSGLFILSASASNQSAYELGRYTQGLLTYSLLKVMKQQPDILEDGKLLNVSRWFNAAEKTVAELSRENGARQEPQVVSNTNFNIGIVDAEVLAAISLPQEKPLFAASNFQNSDENADGDNLELSKLINLQLSDLSTRGSDSKIVYVTATNSPDAYTLSGRYDVKGSDVIVRISIKRNNKTAFRFEQNGSMDKLTGLAAAISSKAAEMVK